MSEIFFLALPFQVLSIIFHFLIESRKRIRPYECEICGHRFSQKHHVAQHIQSKHEHDENRQRPLACEVISNYKIKYAINVTLNFYKY